MTKKVILVWFRNDLRIHDNEILFEAVDKGDIVIPVYIFDPRYFGKNKFDFYHTGVLRAKFLLESVEHLKQQLQELGADLLVFQGKPEDILGKLCVKYDVTEVYHHREVAHRETSISELVETALWKEKINLKHFIGHTLYHKEDLPIPIKDIPEAFTQFKKKVEKESFVRPVLPPIHHITTHPHLEETHLPTLETLGFDPQTINSLSLSDSLLVGGEKNGLNVMRMTLQTDYDDVNDYNLVSPYINLGAISPAHYYHEIKASFQLDQKKKFEKLITRLLWRDYFRFMLKKHPNIYFKNHEKEKDISASVATIKKLLQDGTSDFVINELLNEVKSTGNLPYEHREILAAYLVQEWKINHLAGAAFFEDYLIDYTPASNYGHWLHLASLGTSSKNNLKVSWQELIKKNYRPKTIEK